jgi:hypothetical protein
MDRHEQQRQGELAALERRLAACTSSSTGKEAQLSAALAGQQHLEARLEACGRNVDVLQGRLAEAGEAAGRDKGLEGCSGKLKACRLQLSVASQACATARPAAYQAPSSGDTTAGTGGCTAVGTPCPLFTVSCLTR